MKKFAIVGTGNIAKFHARAINLIKEAKVCAVFNRSIDKAVEFSKKYGGKAYDNYEDLLNDPNIDIVDIVTPNFTHADLGFKAVEHGKHIIVEKPIDVSLKKAEKLVDLCKKNNLKLAVISQKRFCKDIRSLKEKINRLGEITSGLVSITNKRPKEYYSGWKGSANLCGGGVVIMHVIHFIDILRWLLGEVDYVYSINNSHESEVENTASCLLKFKNDAIVNINATTCSNKNESEIIKLIGKNGSVVIKDDSLLKFLSKANYKNKLKDLVPKRFYYKRKLTNQFKKQFLDFIEAIDADKSPLVDGEEGLKDLRVVKALYKSAQTNKAVALK